MIDRMMLVVGAAVGGLLAWLMVGGAGRSADVFWQTPAALFVLAGAGLVSLASCPALTWRSAGSVLRRALAPRRDRVRTTVLTMIALADIARRDGLLAVERHVRTMDDRFLRRAMLMAIDGTDPRVIESVMRAEMEAMDLRHTCGRAWLESMGRLAPAFGMIGTLIGLVVMLGRLDDPGRIGPGMAVALLTTLYGLIASHLLCYPLARRLAHHNSDELLDRTVALQGVLALQAGDSPRLVAEKLSVYLPVSAGTDEFVPSPPPEEASPEDVPAQAGAGRSEAAAVEAAGRRSRDGRLAEAA